MIACQAFLRPPFVKQFALFYRTVAGLSGMSVCLSLCNVGVYWPNGWMDQDATWSRENSSAQVILWCIGPTSSPKGAQHPHFSTHVYCGQTARWIKMPLVVELGFGPGHIVLSFICNSHVHPQTTAANHRTLAGTQLPPAEGRRLSCPM